MLSSFLPKYHADGRAPEVQLAGAVQIDGGDAGVGVLEAAQVLEVAAQADMIIEEAHHARARIPAEHVVRGRNVGKRSAVDLRAQQPDTARDEGSHAAAVSAADRDADHHVAHQVDHAVVAKVGFGAEEARSPAEVHFATDDALPHRAGVDAEASAAVDEAASAIRGYPWADEAIRPGHCRGRNSGNRRRHDQCLDYTPHDVVLLSSRSAHPTR